MRIALSVLLLFIAILFVIGWFVYRPEPMLIQGVVEADEVRVSGKVPGRIEKFMAEEGQMVHVGDTLVLIDSPEVSAKLMQATAAEQAAYSQQRKAQKGARAEVIQGAYEMWQKAKVGVDITKKSFDRVQRLYDKGVITAQKRDETEAAYQAAMAQAAAAKSQYDMAKNGAESEDKAAAEALVSRAQGAVNEVEAYLQETTLRSPISGEVSEIFPKQGELVGTGAPIMNIVNLDNIWVAFNVREDMLQGLKVGTEVEAKVPALGNQKYKFRITYMKAMASYATWKATKATSEFDAKTFELRAKPVQPIQDLRPGMGVVMVK